MNSGSVGKAAPGVDIRIVDDAGEPAAMGEPGEICVRSGVTSHVVYHRAEEKTADMRRGDFVATGDVGYLNDAGFLFISDRKSDMVISGGVNIYPAEIEKSLITMPGVSDCAVFGVPHPEFGEQLIAVIQQADNTKLTPDTVQEFLRGVLAGYKVPRRIEFSDDLPREDSGKIKKRLLRDAYLREAAAAS